MSDEKYVLLAVGERWPLALPAGDQCVFDMQDGGGILNLFLSHLTDDDTNAVRREKKKVALTVKDGVIFLLIKFGGLRWMDVPYSVHLSRRLTTLQKPGINDGYAIQISLVSLPDGIIRGLVLISLPNRLSTALYNAIEDQRREPFDIVEYQARIHRIYATYSSDDLLSFAHIVQNVDPGDFDTSGFSRAVH